MPSRAAAFVVLTKASVRFSVGRSAPLGCAYDDTKEADPVVPYTDVPYPEYH
jgi:hypothetical protein